MTDQLLLVGVADTPITNRPPSQRARVWRRDVVCPLCHKPADHQLTGADITGTPGWTCELCDGVWYDNPWGELPELPEWRTQ